MDTENRKRKIAGVSLALSVTFAIALANAEDLPQGTHAGDPGSGSTSTFQESLDPAASVDQSAGSSETASSTPRICTDRNGVIYTRGQGGFDRCQSEKAPIAEQAGQAAPETMQSPGDEPVPMEPTELPDSENLDSQ